MADYETTVCDEPSCGLFLSLEMYSRGRRGAPAKGVGRLYRRESSNLSISANKKDTQFRVSFLFLLRRWRDLPPLAPCSLASEGADNAAKPSQQVRLPARRAKLLREPCALWHKKGASHPKSRRFRSSQGVEFK